jgi:DNA-binding Xre family transcriptional regulator
MAQKPRGPAGPLTQIVAQHLRDRMWDLHMRPTQVADKAKLPRSTCSKLMNGKTPIYLEQLAALCAALRLSPGTVLDVGIRTLDAAQSGGTALTFRYDEPDDSGIGMAPPLLPGEHDPFNGLRDNGQMSVGD